MTILFDFTLLENDLSFFIVKQNRHAPAKWHRKRIRKGCFEKKIHEKLRAKGHFDFKTPFARVRKGAFTIGLKYVLTLMRSGSFYFLGENKHYFSG